MDKEKRLKRLKTLAKFRNLNSKPNSSFTTGNRYGLHYHYVFSSNFRVFGDAVSIEDIADYLTIDVNSILVCKHRVPYQLTCGACQRMRPEVLRVKSYRQQVKHATSIDDIEDDLFIEERRERRLLNEKLSNPDLDDLIENRQDEFLQLNQQALNLFMVESKLLDSSGFLKRKKNESNS